MPSHTLAITLCYVMNSSCHGLACKLPKFSLVTPVCPNTSKSMLCASLHQGTTQIPNSLISQLPNNKQAWKSSAKLLETTCDGTWEDSQSMCVINPLDVKTFAPVKSNVNSKLHRFVISTLKLEDSDRANLEPMIVKVRVKISCYMETRIIILCWDLNDSLTMYKF